MNSSDIDSGGTDSSDPDSLDAEHDESAFDVSTPSPVPEGISQPTIHTCWAAAAAIMYSWDNGAPLDIDQVLNIADSKLNQSYYLDLLQGETGEDQELDQHEMKRLLSVLDMVAEPAADYSIEGFRDLLSRYGPLWIAVAAGSDAHSLIVDRVYSDGKAAIVSGVDPASGIRFDQYFEDFMQGYEELSQRSSYKGPQVMHFRGR